MGSPIGLTSGEGLGEEGQEEGVKTFEGNLKQTWQVDFVYSLQEFLKNCDYYYLAGAAHDI